MSASGMPVTLYNGQLTRVLEGTDSLYAGTITRSTNGHLAITALADYEVQIGTVGEITRILGDLNVDGAEVVTGGTTFNGNVDLGDGDGDVINLGKDTNDVVNLNTDLLLPDGVDIRFDRVTGSGGMILPGVGVDEVGSIRINSSNELQWWDGDSTWVTAGTSAGASLQLSYEAGNTIAATTTAGALEFSVADDENIAVLSLVQNDVTNNPNALSVSNAGTGAAISLVGAGSRLINSDADDLTISTTTSGTLAINAVAALEIDCTALSYITMSANDAADINFSINATNSGAGVANINIDADDGAINNDSAIWTVEADTSVSITSPSTVLIADSTVAGNPIIQYTDSGFAVDASGLWRAGLLNDGTDTAYYSIQMNTAVAGDFSDNVEFVSIVPTAINIESPGQFVITGITTSSMAINGDDDDHPVELDISVSNVGTAGSLLHIWSTDNVDIAATTEVDITGGDVDINGAAVTIDGQVSSNLSLVANTANPEVLTIASTNAGAGSASLDINVKSAVTMDSASFSIDGTTTSNVSVTGGDLSISTLTSGVLSILSAGELRFADGYKAGSTYSTDLVLSDSSAEWSLFETNFGEVSLINALNQAVLGARWSSVAATGGLVAGDIIAIGETNGEVQKADANGTGNSNITVGICTVGASVGGTVSVASVGKVNVTSSTSQTWTVGAPVYMSTTAGCATIVAPNTIGDNVQVIGYACGDSGGVTSHPIVLSIGLPVEW